MSVLLLTRPQPPELFAGPLRDALPGVDIWESAETAVDARVEAIIAWRLKPGACEHYPNLKLLCATAAGVEKLTVDPTLGDDVRVMRIVDPMVNLGIAQYVALMALRHVRQLPLYAQQQRTHDWIRHRPVDPHTVTVGILGLGEAGRTIARVLHAVGFKLVGWSRTSKALPGIESFAGDEGFDACLARSDILVCALPLTEATRGLLDRSTLLKLPGGAYVINVARGGHVIESDLVSLLDAGHLSGAALDVQETEPLPAEDPLWEHPKIVITPHIAAQASIETVATQFVANFQRLQAGQPLVNLIDRQRGY